MELAGDRVDAEDEKEEVETIERPAKECGQKHMALRLSELSKRGEYGHLREHSRRRAGTDPDYKHTAETGIGSRAHAEMRGSKSWLRRMFVATTILLKAS